MRQAVNLMTAASGDEHIVGAAARRDIIVGDRETRYVGGHLVTSAANTLRGRIVRCQTSHNNLYSPNKW